MIGVGKSAPTRGLVGSDTCAADLFAIAARIVSRPRLW